MNSVRRYALVACAGISVGCVVYGARSAEVTMVKQFGRAFSVAAVQISRGGVIRFTNDDVFDHQIFVESTNFKFHSAEQAPGGMTDVAFPLEGTFDVRCEIHPRMHLSVTVN